MVLETSHGPEARLSVRDRHFDGSRRHRPRRLGLLHVAESVCVMVGARVPIGLTDRIELFVDHPRLTTGMPCLTVMPCGFFVRDLTELGVLRQMRKVRAFVSSVDLRSVRAEHDFGRYVDHRQRRIVPQRPDDAARALSTGTRRQVWRRCVDPLRGLEQHKVDDAEEVQPDHRDLQILVCGSHDLLAPDSAERL